MLTIKSNILLAIICIVGVYCGLLLYWGIREKLEKDKN